MTQSSRYLIPARGPLLLGLRLWRSASCPWLGKHRCPHINAVLIHSSPPVAPEAGAARPGPAAPLPGRLPANPGGAAGLLPRPPGTASRRPQLRLPFQKRQQVALRNTGNSSGLLGDKFRAPRGCRRAQRGCSCSPAGGSGKQRPTSPS